MKVMLVTVPIRPTVSDFPPVGALSILSYLKKKGIEADFYHIEGIRPLYEDALRHIVEARPDIVGISAVVSTSYAYTKRLTTDIKAALPDTLVIVGGPMAASAEILLRCAGVDLCAIGEGEKVMVNVVNRAKTTHKPADFKDILGLALLDDNGELINTGYEDQLGKEEVYDVDWGQLEAASDISPYFGPVFDGETAFVTYRHDSRTFEPHRRNKYIARMIGSKGCVAKCTFCHRFGRGIRYIPMNVLEKRLIDIIERYNVGFIIMGDENFGTDHRWLAEFCDMMKRHDILWSVGGMRVNCIDSGKLAMMRDAGCVGVIYGMETGSRQMIEVMEKKVKVEDNYNAMRWTIDAGLKTVVQLVIGMPGENTSTIDETAEFVAFANSLDKDQRPWDVSINYAQALPGTPLYEYGRREGLIARTLEGEEQYLLHVSNRDAADEYFTLNFTDEPSFIHKSWRHRIQAITYAGYVKKFGKQAYVENLLKNTSILGKDRAKLPSLASLLMRGRIGTLIHCYPEILVRFLWVLPLVWLLTLGKHYGIGFAIKDLRTFLTRRRRLLNPNKSLRKVVFEEMPPIDDNPAMEPLRRGR